jgi:hypothetical protein
LNGNKRLIFRDGGVYTFDFNPSFKLEDVKSPKDEILKRYVFTLYHGEHQFHMEVWMDGVQSDEGTFQPSLLHTFIVSPTEFLPLVMQLRKSIKGMPKRLILRKKVDETSTRNFDLEIIM